MTVRQDKPATGGIPAQLSQSELNRIHDATMEVLRDVGIVFHDDDAIAVFKRHGIRVAGRTVYLSEDQVAAATESAPAQFKLSARNPQKDVIVGGPSAVLAPGYGAPFVITADGAQRAATLEDYNRFCQLIQTSPQIDVNGFLMVDPSDCAPQTAHLDMLLAAMTLCDKPFMGSPLSAAAAEDTLQMAEILGLSLEQPVTIANINALSPLQFASEMAGALMVFARKGQAVIVMGGGMMGSTTPIQGAGSLVVQNAAVLAGLTLAQLVRPQAPVVYGTGGAPLDMQTGAYSLGAPEFIKSIAGGAQMARFYDLPARGGGAISDAHCPDIQAGAESALNLSAALSAGIDFVLHSAGILGAYLAMSFEKFIVDEDLCAMLRVATAPLAVNDETIDMDAIKQVGPHGNYLTHASTLKLCRSAFFRSDLRRPVSYSAWSKTGQRRLEQQAALAVEKRIAAYKKPDLDPGIDRDLTRFVSQRKDKMKESR